MAETDQTAGRSVWFVGDLDDPWVVSIADALPGSARRLDCPGDLPENLVDQGSSPNVLVLHRATLTRHDAEIVRQFRSGSSPSPRVVLCHGPHVRYADLERWGDLWDAVIPEATARETVARRLHPAGEGPGRRAVVGSRPRVAVVAATFALRQTLAEACQAAGYPVASARDWEGEESTGPAVWEVPVLDPKWPETLASARARRGGSDPIIALIGFADRGLVVEARSRGASACLELPLDLADLFAVLDRLTPPRPEPAHELPPAPAARRRPSRAVADRGRDA